MCIFHKWGMWVQYEQKVWDAGTIMVPRNPPILCAESREKRRCIKCGKGQDRKVKGSH